MRWQPTPPNEIIPASVEVVAANLDRSEVLDPSGFGDSRDLVLAAALGGHGGVPTALAAVLAASNRGGSRGGADLRSWHPLVGSWAGNRIAASIPLELARDFTDVSGQVREILTESGQGRYEVSSHVVTRPMPPCMRVRSPGPKQADRA